MRNLAFVCQPTVGHLNTLLTIALQMRADGHNIRFIVPGLPATRKMEQLSLFRTAADIPRRIAAQGFTVHPIRPPLSTVALATAVPLDKTSGYTELVVALMLFSSGLVSYAQAIRQILKDDPVDGFVSDFAFLATSLAADLQESPYVTVYHSGLPFRGPGIPPFGSGLAIGDNDSPAAHRYARREQKILTYLDRKINRARHKLGLPPGVPDLLRRPYSPHLNLITSDPCIEAPRDFGNAPVRFVGPCFARRPASDSAGFPFQTLRRDKRIVYVSLGTVFNNRPKVFLTLLSALDQDDLQVIVSAGESYPALKRAGVPANVLLFPSVPQTQLLLHVDLFISHGGNNSTNESLAAGVPLLVLPIGGEQGDNAARVTYLGAGLRADVGNLSIDTLRKLVHRLLNEPQFRRRTRQLASELAKTDGPKAASTAISDVMRLA